MALASRFRGMLADMGLSNPDAAKLLHVSLRTLQNWLSGRHQVPYAVYKLLRLMRYMELPGKAWEGWHFSRGQLVTPEGRTIDGSEGAWWSLLVRQSKGFEQLYGEVQRLKRIAVIDGSKAAVRSPLPEVAAPVFESLGSGVPVTRHFSPEIRTNTAADLGVEVPVTPHLSPISETFTKNLPRYEMRLTTPKASFELARGSL
jgi:hypothetical protein